MKRLVRLLTILVLGFAIAGVARASVTVTLRERATVSGGYVRLAEVARLQGDGDQAALLARIFLGPAPAKGDVRTISRGEIQRRLEETGCTAPVRFDGSTAVDVRLARADGDEPAEAVAQDAPTTTEAAAPRTLNAEDGSALFGQAMLKYMSVCFGRRDLTVRTEVQRMEKEIPVETAALRVVDVTAGRLPGRGRVLVTALDGRGRERGRLTAWLEVTVRAPVVVLRRRLDPQEQVNPRDVMVATKELEAGAAYLPAEAKAIVGRAAAKSLRPNEPLRLDDLTEPIAVRQGQIVRVDTHAGGFRVQSYARATRDARTGDLLMVQNLNPENATKKTYLARVTGMGTVALATLNGESE